MGVNTINYDLSFRNKTKTREERKMEMIMKAFEDMEKSAAMRRAEGESGASVTKPEKKRRRSNSIKVSLVHSTIFQNIIVSFTDNIFSRLEATRGPVGILTWTRAPLTSVTRPVWPSP